MIEFLKLSAEALVLTIAIEVSLAWLIGLRSKTELLTVVLINVVTNPLLNYLNVVNDHFHLVSQAVVLMLCLEVVVVLAEWKLLVYVLRQSARKMFVLSVMMNAASCLAGLLILW